MGDVAVELPFGSRFIKIEVPRRNLIATVEPRQVQAVVNGAVEAERALRNPIGEGRISDLVRKGSKVVILSEDNTRPTPVNEILPPILKELNKCGVKDEDITAIMALGTHRPMSDKEMSKKLGEEIADRIEVVNHECEHPESLRHLGKTSKGTPILVNKMALKADFMIGVGMICPHRVAGYGGGAKIVQPGISGKVTTGHTHWMSALYEAEKMMGTKENPVREEMNEIASKAKLGFIINAVLNREGRIVKVVAGDFIKAFKEGVQEARKIWEVNVPEKADIVIADSHPADLDMWQAAKAIYASELIVKPGGTIILITPCSEGVSKQHPQVLQFGYRPFNELKNLLREKELTDLVAAAHMAHVSRVIREKAKCILVSEGINESDTLKLGFEYAKTPQEATNRALDDYGRKARVIVIKESSELLPIARN